MGAEAECLCEHGRERGEGKAMLETDKLLFRGAFRLAIPLAQVTSAKVEDDALVVAWKEGRASFHLGAARSARWAEKILHPPTRLDKAGVKAGTRVALVGVTDEALAKELREAGAEVVGKDADVVFAQVEEPEGLAALPGLAKALRKDAALWIVSPRGRPEIADTVVMAAARKAGLVDTKVMRFSETHTALRFTWPKAGR